jgi:Tfp pilus assembly PilM family ATPase
MISSRQPGWIGVDIGTHAVKVAQVERHHASVRLREALVIRRRTAWSTENLQITPTSSSEELTAALSLGAQFHGRQTALTLPMAVCDARGLQLEDRSDTDPWELVLKELEAAYPNAADLREFDFWPLQLPDDRGPASENTIVLSVPRSWTERVAEDLAEARLVGRVLDGLPLALARAVELRAPGSSQSPVAAVDWGCGRATLCAVFGGQPAFVRCLRDAGFDAVLQALCETLSVNRDEAQKLLTDHGLPDHDQTRCEELQEVIQEVIAEPLDRFLEEVRRTLAYLQQQRRSLMPQQLILFGGGASIRNIAKFVTEKLDLPAEPWDFPAKDTARPSSREWSMPVLGPAIALSTLAWVKS